MVLIFERDDFSNLETIKSGNEINGQVLYWVNFYFYKGLVIDTGCPHTADEVRNAFKNRNVKAVLLTHHHEDHIGGANALKSLGARVFAPEESLEILYNPPEIPEYRKYVWGQPEPIEAEPLESIESLELDAEVDVEVIDTPGHSPDHVCFLIGDKLFSGDLVVTSKQMVCMRSEEYTLIIDSLEKILEKDFSIAFGGPGIATRKEVEDYLKYLKNIQDRAKEMCDSGKSIKEIIEELFPKPPEKVLLMESFSEGEWSRKNFVKSLLGLSRD